MEVSQMRKQQYIATVACLVAGVIGFVSVYATDKAVQEMAPGMIVVLVILVIVFVDLANYFQ